MTKQDWRCSRGVVLLTIVWALTAQTAELKESTAGGDTIRYHLDPVVVTATKMVESQREIAASVSVLQEAVINAAPSGTLMGALMQRVPGLYVTERAVMGYGVSGGAGTVSMRGVGGSPVTGVLFLRDGRPDMMGLFGHPLPDSYGALGIERVEVVRGPASFLYGTNAMGGVINLISKRRHEEGFETRLQGSAGEFATRSFSIAHGGKSGRWDYYVTGSTGRSDGHRANSAYQGLHYTAHAGYAAGPATRIDLNSNLANIDLVDPGRSSSPASGQWYDLRRRGLDLSLAHQSRWGESQLKLHGNFGRHRVYDGFISDDHTYGLMLYQTGHPWAGAAATLGLDWKRYGGSAQNRITGMVWDAHQIEEFAPYLHWQQLIRTRFVISGGVRVEHHQLFGYAVLPKLGLVIHPQGRTALRFSAGRGFRSPTIRELYLFPAPTADLGPESMWNYEAGVTQQLGGRMHLEAVLFRSEGSDMIRVIGRYPDLQLVNSGDFIHSGYEVALHWEPAEQWEVTAGWSKHDLGDQTMNSPGKKLSLGLDVPWRSWRLGVAGHHVRDLFGADRRAQPLPDYTLVDASLGWQPVRTLALRLMVKNALDARYQTMSGYPMPGRNVVLESTLEL